MTRIQRNGIALFLLALHLPRSHPIFLILIIILGLFGYLMFLYEEQE
jgi:hypothetical protein